MSRFRQPRQAGRLALAALSLVAVAVAGAVRAAEPPVEPDIVLAAKVSSAIASDPGLGGMNLTVDVVNRAAEIGGPVASVDLIPKIEAAARTVSGVLSVKVTAWVPSSNDTFRRAVEKELTRRLPPAAGSDVGRSTMPPLVLLPRVDSPGLPPVAESSRVIPPLNAAPQSFGPVTVQRVPLPATGFLLDPVGPGGIPISPLPMPAASSELPAPAYPTIPPPAVPVLPVGLSAGVGSTESEIERVRSADPRFARLKTERRGGIVVITGSAVRTADAWDFATALRRVPGVDRVVVGEVVGR